MGNSLELAHLQGLQAFFLGTYLGYFVCGPPNLRGGRNFHSDKIKFSRNVSSLCNYGKSVAFGEGEDILRNSAGSKSWEASALRDLNSTQLATFELRRILVS